MRSAVVSVVSSVLTTLLAVTAINVFADDGPQPDRSAESRATLGTAFTYQGKLETGGAPAEGSHTMRFTLHSDSTVPSPVGAPIQQAVQVTAGLFAAELDFGPSAFDGNARWLQVEVHNGSGFDNLSPRQQLTAVPYALFALGAPWTGITGVPSGLADGVDNDTQYTAGVGVLLTGTQFSVQFLSAGPVNGTADTAARSDHTHFAQAWTGNSASPGLSVTNTGSSVGIIGVTSHEHSAGVLGVAEDNGMGVIGVAQPDTSLPAGERRGIGVVSRSYLSGGNPLYGDAAATGSGVYGESSVGAGLYGFGSVIGVDGVAVGSGIGVRGYAGESGVTGRSPNRGVSGFGGEFQNGAWTGGSGTGVQGFGHGPSGEGILGVGADGAYGGRFVGNVSINGVLVNPSDVRMKQNIEPIRYGLEQVQALRPVTYSMKQDESNSPRFGLIAQDVQQVLPELVLQDETIGMLSLSYVELFPILIKAIQEQQAQIEALGGGNTTRALAGNAQRDNRSTVAETWALPSALALFALAVGAHALLSLRRKSTEIGAGL